jgi:4-hydroxy-3-methylbut-2-enyl diphosphate reductase
VHLIQTEADIDTVAQMVGPFALLSQTTLSLDEWQGLRDYAIAKIPDLWLPNRSDLCFATTNRQAALREIAVAADAVVVIGSANSSNTVALTKVASSVGSAKVYRVNAASELPEDLSGVIGVTAGASAPESLVNEVLHRLNAREGVYVNPVTIEDEYFPPPPELRELLRSLESLISLSFSGLLPQDDVASRDRDFSAAAVLAH